MKALSAPRIAAYASALLILSCVRPAPAVQTQIALDLDFAQSVSVAGVDSGGGGALRLGQELDLIAVTVIGEFGLGYHSFGGSADVREYTGLAGGRLRIGKFLEPGAFFHVGASHLVDTFDTSWAPMLDLGLSLDLTLFPLVDIGLHGTYVHRFPTDSESTFRYLIVGPHVAIVF